MLLLWGKSYPPRLYGVEKYPRKVRSRETARAGKRLAWPLLPIREVDQGMSTVERDTAGTQQQETVKRKQKDTVEERGIEKKRESKESGVTEQM